MDEIEFILMTLPKTGKLEIEVLHNTKASKLDELPVYSVRYRMTGQAISDSYNSQEFHDFEHAKFHAGLLRFVGQLALGDESALEEVEDPKE